MLVEELIEEINLAATTYTVECCTKQCYTTLYKCAWQESNLLPLGPQPNALSGELQARERLSLSERPQPRSHP